MTQFLIGLAGFAGSGKDTVREMLEAEGFVGLALADPIRQMLRELLTSNGISDDWMYERALKEAEIPELGVSYRHLAQTLGTEWGRSIDPAFWLRLAGAHMDSLTEDGETHFVISDVRFPNEAAWVRERGGQIWLIDRPGLAPVRNHPSEAEILSIEADQVIDNSGDMDYLADRVVRALEAFA